MASDPSEWGDLYDASHQTIASYLGVPGDRLVLTPSCTAALGLAVGDLAWRAGDRALTSHFEHHALHRNLLQLRRLDVETTVIPPTRDMPIDLNRLEQELKAGDVRLLAVTAACNVTGCILPIQEIIELGHRFDAKVLIDGAQIVGWSDLDVTALGADLFTFAGHKAPHGPWGIGGLYVAPDLNTSGPLAVCELQEQNQVCARIPGFCDVGSVNVSALSGLAAGIEWISSPSQSDRLARCRLYANKLINTARELDGVTLHSADASDSYLPTVALTFDRLTVAEAASRLKRVGVIASCGFQCSPQAHVSLGTDSQGVVRFSFGPQNKIEDVDVAIEAVTELAATR